MLFKAFKATPIQDTTLVFYENTNNPYAYFLLNNDLNAGGDLFIIVNNDYLSSFKDTEFYSLINEYVNYDFNGSVLLNKHVISLLSQRSILGFDVFCLSIIETPLDILQQIIRYIKQDISITEKKEEMKMCKCHCGCEQQLKSTTEKKLTKTFNVEDKNNNNEYTTYIILRNDLNRSVAEQMCDIVEISNKLYGIPENIVILQANYNDLFVDNFIPTKLDNPDIQFVTLTNNEKKVAHSNFRLTDANITALGYYGVKKDMPKFIKKLKLYS